MPETWGESYSESSNAPKKIKEIPQVRETPEHREIKEQIDHEKAEVRAQSIEERRGLRLNMARNTDDSNLLRKLAGDENYLVRTNVAENKNTPSDVLDILAEDKYHAVFEAVAGNPNTESKTLKYLAWPHKDSLTEDNAKKNLKNKEILIQIKDPNPDVRNSIAKNPNTKSDILEMLAKDTDERVRCSVTWNKNTPPKVLDMLAKDTNQDVRRGVAMNKNTKSEVLEILAKDAADIVRSDVAMNPHTERNVLEILSKDSIAYVRYCVVYNYQTESDVVQRLSKDQNNEVARSAWLRYLPPLLGEERKPMTITEFNEANAKHDEEKQNAYKREQYAHEFQKEVEEIEKNQAKQKSDHYSSIPSKDEIEDRKKDQKADEEYANYRAKQKKDAQKEAPMNLFKVLQMLWGTGKDAKKKDVGATAKLEDFDRPSDADLFPPDSSIPSKDEIEDRKKDQKADEEYANYRAKQKKDAQKEAPMNLFKVLQMLWGTGKDAKKKDTGATAKLEDFDRPSDADLFPPEYKRKIEDAQ